MSELEIVAMKWEDFLEWFKIKWELGQHVALVGPTGAGKTVYVVNILPMRKYVIALDAKGGDESLELLTRKGFEYSKWPLTNRQWRDIEEGKPAR